MLELKVKDIRETFEETLGKFYAVPDFSINPTKVMDRDKEFRIEFRIYDAKFWMDIDPSIASVRIATRALGVLDAIDSIQMWLSKPFEYDKKKFEFGWRTDLEAFFDAFQEALLENSRKRGRRVLGSSTKVDEPKSGIAQCIDAVYGKANETKDTTSKDINKPSIFNSLKNDEDEDEYI